jgi:hypothetical protein
LKKPDEVSEAAREHRSGESWERHCDAVKNIIGEILKWILAGQAPFYGGQHHPLNYHRRSTTCFKKFQVTLRL